MNQNGSLDQHTIQQQLLQHYNAFLSIKAVSYETLLRNGYRVPKKTAPITTKKFIQEVMSKACFSL